ncbi:hypothetical protein RclHR1_06170018 [Rhizophagus clarus]|uniref:Crinkler (CRN) family protein, putative n=1 Tax=Rhizophagus clarus TaxID=94130 RepID=A0A2Z6RRM9_9GLOM|nr:hypothetical protein RclHR1_06170018 [Rhizophagus clarus]GES76675.1 crinkler (CRN) family protein, putative [Rhizophagus clarus]
MITPKVWFKLVNPTDNWTKVSLEEVDDVDDLKKKIKIEMAPKLDTFTSSSLTLKATYNNDNPNEAVELHEKEELVSVLRRFNIEETNVKDSFAKNILLFVIASSDEQPVCNLQYNEPVPLLHTDGVSWEFQESENLTKVLKEGIEDHYYNFRDGKLDKNLIPIYLILAGAGTGKSRTATELPRLVEKCVDSKLKSLISKRLVFNISFENGTQFDPYLEKNASIAIGTRMLYQLKPDEQKLGFSHFRHKYNDVTASGVLEGLKNYMDVHNIMTLFLTIDGLQTAITNGDDGLNKNSLFYSFLTEVANLSRTRSTYFFIGTCTATVTNPFGQYIATSSQKRIMLPITSLKPPKRRINNSICPVFTEHPIVNMLVNDMGGHGRALETLEKALKNKDLENVNFIDLSGDIRCKLGQTYSYWTQRSKGIKQLLRIILTHQLVYKDQFIFDDCSLEDFTKLGLINFEPCDVNDINCASGYLSCPYVWLWIVAHSTNDEILKDWNFNYIQEKQHEADPSISPGLQYYQHFENFISRIRILKSKLFAEDAWVLLKDLHHGANHTFNDAKIYNQHLQLEIATQRESTKFDKLSKIQCDKGLIDPCGKYCIINAPGAPAGDSFVYGISLRDLNESSTAIIKANEVHQCKLLKKSTINQKDFEKEQLKATGKHDIFILFTCGESQVNLSNYSAVVDKGNWENYFGPFAGRAFTYANTEPPNANTASVTQLSGITGIGKKYAGKILEIRKRKLFDDLDDCYRRTKISRKVLENLRF